MMKTIPAILLILSLLPVHAREAGDGKPRDIQLRGFAFSLFENTETLELRAGDEIIGQLSLPTGQLQSRIRVAERGFSFGVVEDNAFRSLGSVTLPEAGDDFIIVFAAGAAGYDATVVRSDDPEFKGDDVHLFNFTPYKLGITLGTTQEEIAPRANARIRPGFSEGDDFYQAMFTYEKDGSQHPFNNTRWPINPNTKALLFVFKDPATGQIAHRTCIELAKP